MDDPEQRLVFSGVDNRTDATLPAWYERTRPDAEPISFADAIRRLPRATETTVAYKNPYTDEWVSTERFSAIVEPGRLQQQADQQPPSTDGGTTVGGSPAGETVDPLFHVPTSSYAIINPVDVYAPLEEVLRETEYEGQPLGELVFGEMRQYRGGGEVHMDIMFDGLSVTLPERREPITMGLTSGYDFFGNHAVYVEGFARDTACANSIRSLTDRETIKHVGDVEAFDTWWDRLLDQLGFLRGDLAAFIDDAQTVTLDLTSVPFDLTEFYELLEFPTYLATQAAQDARANAADPFAPDMWTLHSGATYALTHAFTGKEGSALDRYVRTANDILFNPEGTLERVRQEFEARAEAETDADGQTDVASQAALAQLERVTEDLRAQVSQFETREERLRNRLTDAAE
ncbi:hypothetical protein DU500_05955 [Haloplanus rubicundus]|uniref:DUF932 domain-containing protein n=1 Tax=Haloplanus rubicundus TaxID=1547898 RepID=A0A345E1F2_9EURY|nr:hypothetical protein [Haloplanus rubicundus]AXG06024.1 hypothetical protein DU500_05955 [Haloplanus rubicundus]